jgi:uncharacterized protein YdaU (DUF1376 family)
MHYFKRNIGDYHKKAGRLTMLQHGAYTLLIDACYDRERFPSMDDAIDWCWASSDDEIQAVTFVVSKFFDLVDGLYIQSRIQDEIDNYHKNSKTNKRIAIERETKRAANSTKRVPSVDEATTVEHEAPPNQEPLTKNHEPLTINQEQVTKEKKTSAPVPVDFSVFNMSPADLAEVKRIRVKNKGGAITTQRVANGLAKEITMAIASGLTIDYILTEWETRGWKSVKAEWLTKDQNQGGYQKQNSADKIQAQGERLAAMMGQQVQRPVEADYRVINPQLGLDHE